MTIETARVSLLWCSVINYAMLILWAVLMMFGRDRFYRIWSRWFQLSAEHFNLINVAGMMFYKLAIFLFNIVPCIVLYLVK